MWKLIGLGAATLTMFSFVPQLVKIYRTKSSDDVSPWMLFQFAAGVSLWIFYGIHLNDQIIICANVVTLVTLFAALVLYSKYNK
jgi:MtN3 and saliva related transmembrane protein